MTNFTRRDFLKALAASAVLTTVGRGLAPFSFADKTGPFELLVVGDSVIWGQGLEEKDKFYTLTKQWLESEAFGARREVNLNLTAHSGSTLKLHADVAEKYKKAGRDETFYYNPEMVVDFPSIWKQLEVAADEYERQGKAQGADLVMLTGCIPDITVSKVLDPYGDNEELPLQIQKYCQDDMYDVLELAATKNPNALLAVIGYYPMLSPKTSGTRLFNNWLEIKSFPRPFKPLANNGLVRKLFFNKLRKKGIVRSRIWFDESTKRLQAAVDKLNSNHGAQRAVFVKSPITEDTCFETPNTLLFRMGKKGVTDDPLYAQRLANCKPTMAELKRSTGIDYPVRLCEMAAVGHPNPAGSRAYAEAIKSALATRLRQGV
jgi:lysophospholipase L1-like esterase